MKIAVLGAGAMGSLYGGYLSSSNKVYLVDVWEEHVKAINKNGLTIDKKDQTRIFNPKATTSSASVGEVDLVIVFVKSIHTAQALQNNVGLIGSDTLLLTLQNGYGNAEDMLSFVSEDRVLVGTTAHGCTMRGPGHIFHAGSGATHIGAYGKDDTYAKQVVELLTEAGFETDLSENVMGLVWSKLFANIGINAITALLGTKNIVVAENHFAMDLAKKLVYEAVQIANADGMDFNPEEIIKNVLDTASRTGSNTSSMLADVQNKRPTEIQKINGAVVKKAEALGVQAPYNEALVSLIAAKESIYE